MTYRYIHMPLNKNDGEGDEERRLEMLLERNSLVLRSFGGPNLH